MVDGGKTTAVNEKRQLFNFEPLLLIGTRWFDTLSAARLLNEASRCHGD